MNLGPVKPKLTKKTIPDIMSRPFWLQTMRVTPSFVERCLSIIELLAEQGRRLKLGDIAQGLEIPKGDLHRLLSILSALGWVEQDPETGFYGLTIRISILGHRFLSATRIPDVCQPVLDRLARDSGESAQLALVENRGLTTVAQSQGMRSGLVYRPKIFVALPLHASASGKAWLATLPSGEALAVVRKAGLGVPGQLGPKAIRSFAAVAREIKLAKSRGWGLARDEAMPGGSAVAAAICPQGGDAVGVVTVTGPTFRMQDDSIPEMARLVQAAAADLAALWPLRALRRPMPRPERSLSELTAQTR